MAVKDDYLYIGGLGKEWTTSDGEVLNFNPMYIKKVSHSGKVQHIDWHTNYIKLRETAGIEFPGYMIHESACYSPVTKSWTFLPRRASKSKYNDVDDERRGTNLMLTAKAAVNVDDENEPFSDVKVKEIETLDQPSHGFSSFKYIPGTKDDLVVALKSEELEGKIATYILVFRASDGKIIKQEEKIGDIKYEGIEFI